jgi:hypothetical protein
MFFFFQFFDVAEVAIIHKMIFATFGYELDMKVGKKNRILLYLWLLIETYCRKYGDSEKNSFKIWRVWAIFFPCKVLCKGRNHILEVEIWRNFAEKKGVITSLVATNKNP